MKNKYIDELNNIHADSSFKQKMIQKMEYESNKKIRFSNTTIKYTLGFACICLLFISIFTYKTYQQMQLINQQFISNKKQTEQLATLKQNDLERFMVRNETSEEEIKYSYCLDPYKYGGMGNGEFYFPAMESSQINNTDLISIDESNYYQQLPVGVPTNHVFTIKEKKEIIYKLIEYFNIKEYNVYLNDEYISILSSEYAIEVRNEEIIITNKVKDELENREAFIHDFIQSNPMIFKNKYDIENYDNSELRYYSVLYEKTEDILIDESNANEEIKIEISFNHHIYMRIIFDHCYLPEYYPALSYKQALKQIEKGYYEEGMAEYTDINKIYTCKLIYLYNIDDNVYLPYYKFYVGVHNLDLAEKNGFIIENKEYVLSVLVPAISEKYIEYQKN